MRRPTEIRGVDRFQRSLAALGRLKGLSPALRAEAEAVAAEARGRLTQRDPDSGLARSIKIIESGTEDQPAFAVGTDDPAGFFLEFGTARSRADPWLVPALHARLPSINHTVRKVIGAALKAAAKV